MIHSIFSTLPSFKKIDALQPGLNVLLSQKTSGSTNKQTRNRASKTSFVEIVHFLFGANVDKNSRGCSRLAAMLVYHEQDNTL